MTASHWKLMLYFMPPCAQIMLVYKLGCKQYASLVWVNEKQQSMQCILTLQACGNLAELVSSTWVQ